MTNNEANPLIGTYTTYVGGELGEGQGRLTGKQVRIYTIVRTSMIMEEDQDFSGHPDFWITDDAHLRKLGGVHPRDRVEIGFPNPKTGRDVLCDAPVTDLACFRHLLAE
ncbi:MAG: hypothetical protein AB7K71_33380 [Polyangiaceae bacterium]